MAQTNKDYSVPAIEKTIMILNALSINGKMTINDFHTQLKIPKTTVFVILNTLERHSLIEKKDDGRYNLGHGVLYWGMNYYKQNDIKQIAKPHLEKLVEGTPYSAHLAVLVKNQPVYIDKFEGNGFVRFATTIGQSVPLHLSGVGKALAVGMSDEEIEQTIIPASEQASPNSRRILDTMLEDVAFVRTNGYSIEDEQMEEGIRCIGAPIYSASGAVVASISVTSLSKDLNAIKFHTIGQLVKEAALQISKESGYLM